jgi:hypothetical protein
LKPTMKKNHGGSRRLSIKGADSRLFFHELSYPGHTVAEPASGCGSDGLVSLFAEAFDPAPRCGKARSSVQHTRSLSAGRTLGHRLGRSAHRVCAAAQF